MVCIEEFDLGNPRVHYSPEEEEVQRHRDAWAAGSSRSSNLVLPRRSVE